MEHFFKEKVHIWRDSTTGIATQAKENGLKIKKKKYCHRKILPTASMLFFSYLSKFYNRT